LGISVEVIDLVEVGLRTFRAYLTYLDVSYSISQSIMML
jgi:hypothetical protein